MAPAGDFALAPKAAVFLSYAELDQNLILDIAGSITRCGAAVFLGAKDRSDRELRVLSALSFADEVLILITPTESFKTPSTRAFLESPSAWLAIGMAYARGIPIRGLLKGTSPEKVRVDQSIPRFIRTGQLYDNVKRYEDDLRSRIQIERRATSTAPAADCSVCLCQGGNNTALRSTIEVKLRDAGILPNPWSDSLRAERFDAAVVVFDGEASSYWEDPAFVFFLQSFFIARKPVAFVTLPGQSPGVPAWFQPAWRVDYREPDKLSFLQLVWEIIHYEYYPMEPTETINKTIVDVDLVDYTSIAQFLQQSLGPSAVAQLNSQIQELINEALNAAGTSRDQAVMTTTGDGAILLFDSAEAAHVFSGALHRASEEWNRGKDTRTQRWFRAGAATGQLTRTLAEDGRYSYSGTTIIDAVRLETASRPGEFLIDVPTYDLLPQEMRRLYGPEET